jgi:hypothetical protein
VTVQAMGYFWVGTSKLDDWTSLATGQLGLQQVGRSRTLQPSMRWRRGWKGPVWRCGGKALPWRTSVAPLR